MPGFNYADIVFPNEQLAEEEAAYSTLRERHVQALWLEQKYFKNPLTTDGQVVEVLSPGVWNASAGPDFQHAHIRIGDRELWGDIEIHLSENSWYHHQHHKDPGYNKVVLHVALWNDHSNQSLLTEDHRDLPKLQLENFLTIPVKRLLRLVDLDLYPYKRFTPVGRCQKEVFSKLSDSETYDLLYGAAVWRLEEKRRFLHSWIENPSLWVAGGIAMALGYRQNARAFLELFNKLQKLKLGHANEYLALSLGYCGFFDQPYLRRWTTSDEYCHLNSVWKDLRQDSAPRIDIHLGQQRPMNHPIRRLAYLSRLLVHPSYTQLTPILHELWKQSWKKIDGPRNAKKMLQTLCETVPLTTDRYWNFHYTFEANPQKSFLPMIGNPTRELVVVNTLLPLLYHDIRNRNQLNELKAFERLFSAIRSPVSQKRRYLQHRFFPKKKGQSFLLKSALEQGAFQIHRDFCVHHEASCDGCQFSERIQGVKSPIKCSEKSLSHF